MTLQAKLTLGSVLLATLMVGLISTVDLRNVMQLEFEFTLERADLVMELATAEVKDALNRPTPTPYREALRDGVLFGERFQHIGRRRDHLALACLDRCGQLEIFEQNLAQLLRRVYVEGLPRQLVDLPGEARDFLSWSPG